MFFVIPFLIVSIVSFSLNQPIPTQSTQIPQSNLSQSSKSLNQKSSLPKIEIQPLIADKDNDVAVLEGCDLTLRFPKKIGKIMTKDIEDEFQLPGRLKTVGKDIFFEIDLEL